MKALKIILIILVVLIGGYFIWMSTLPADYKVERSTVVDARPSTVYATVSDFKTWPEWGPWMGKDSTMKIVWGDKTQGEGASYSWTSKNSGSGSQSITEASPDESLNTHIKFNGMGESDGYWKFEPVDDNKTRVTWGFTGSFPLWGRIFSLGMDKQVGHDFEEGLSKLKEKVESTPQEKAVDITMVDVQPMPYYGIKEDITIEQGKTSDYFGSRYKEIMGYLGEDAKNQTAPPFAIYYKWDEANNQATVEPAIAADSKKPGNDHVTKGITYSGKALKAIHTGGYNTGAEHMAMEQYIKKNNYSSSGSPWEVYVTDPGMEPDSTKWITEVYYPIINPAGDSDTGSAMESN